MKYLIIMFLSTMFTVTACKSKEEKILELYEKMEESEARMDSVFDQFKEQEWESKDTVMDKKLHPYSIKHLDSANMRLLPVIPK